MQCYTELFRDAPVCARRLRITAAQNEFTLQTKTSRHECRCSGQVGSDRTGGENRRGSKRERVGHNVFEFAQLVAAAEITGQIVSLDPELWSAGNRLA